MCSAYYLQKEGHKVTVLDQSEMEHGASYVNAGYISPSHIVPLSAPGVVKKGIQWMFNPASPFYVKPRLDLDFLKWAWAFNKSCTHKHVKRSIPVIRDISVFSRDLYRDIKKEAGFDFHFEKKGLLMLCKTEKMLEEEIEVAGLASEVGLETEILNKSALDALESDTQVDALGATFYKCDAHTTPREFMQNMKSHLRSNGVEIRSNEALNDLEMSGNAIMEISTAKGSYKADEFVLATGSWSGLIAKKLGMKLLMQAGKGYRINVERQTKISYPAILAEAKVAVTPMNGFTRFAGTMEISNINNDINPTRVGAIAKAAHSYYPEISISEQEKKEASSGLRPLSPDGLPYIGKPDNCKNLTIAAGHAMMGWTMATGTGKLVSEIISDKKSSLNMNAFNPNRTF